MTSISYIDQAAYSVATQGTQPETTPVMGSKSLNLSQRLRYRTSDLRRELTGYIRYGYRDQDGDGLRRNKYLSHSLGGQAYQAFGELHNLRLDYNHELYNRDNFLSVSKERTPIFHFTGNTVRLQYNFGAEEKTPVLVNAGIELYHERLRSERFTTAATRHQATAGTIKLQLARSTGRPNGIWCRSSRLSRDFASIDTPASAHTSRHALRYSISWGA